MAGESSLLCEEQFECIICTEFFRNPVTLPCGHNFCQVCIEQHWRDKKVRKCPLCNQEFDKSLKLSINTVFRDIVESFKQDYDVSESEKPSGPDQVLCDCCLQSKRRAAQTCLVCLTSYCTAHLEPHRRVAALTTHTLTDPVPNLHQNMCTKHHRILEESSCGQGMVCALCSSNETSSTRGDNKVFTPPSARWLHHWKSLLRCSQH
uniref:RING-type domain-containing protein n=1 Tax=Knipowitschia caucasica TaxID=637954 RepID=A0AAV2MBR0_KNICA